MSDVYCANILENRWSLVQLARGYFRHFTVRSLESDGGLDTATLRLGASTMRNIAAYYHLLVECSYAMEARWNLTKILN